MMLILYRFITLPNERSEETLLFIFWICSNYGYTQKKIKSHPTFIFRPHNICNLFFLAATPRFLCRSLFSALSQLGSLVVVCRLSVPLLKQAAKPLEWAVEVKESRLQVSELSVLLNHCTYLWFSASSPGFCSICIHFFFD